LVIVSSQKVALNGSEHISNLGRLTLGVVTRTVPGEAPQDLEIVPLAFVALGVPNEDYAVAVPFGLVMVAQVALATDPAVNLEGCERLMLGLLVVVVPRWKRHYLGFGLVLPAKVGYSPLRLNFLIAAQDRKHQLSRFEFDPERNGSAGLIPDIEAHDLAMTLDKTDCQSRLVVTHASSSSRSSLAQMASASSR
jgi:hypothetical protein